MEKKAVHRFKWFWPWQDEKEESWLRALSQQGLHLKSASRWGIYAFSTGEPRDMLYLTAYSGPAERDEDGFVRPFELAGWEYVADSYWHYFRRPVQAGELPLTAISLDSKIKKYRGRLGYYIVAMALLVLIPEEITRRVATVASDLFQLICFLLFLLALFIIFKIRRRIQQLNYAEYRSKSPL